MTDNKMTTEQMLDWLDEELKWYYRQNIGPEIELNRRIWAVKSISTFIQSSTAERERLEKALNRIANMADNFHIARARSIALVALGENE